MVDMTGGGRMHYVSNLVSSPISILSKLFPHGEGDATLLSLTLGVVTVVCLLLFTWYFPHYQSSMGIRRKKPQSYVSHQAQVV